MKRIIPILFLLVFALIFVGCENNSVPEEKVLGITQVPLDTNVPPESELNPITGEEKDLLINIFAHVVTNAKPVDVTQNDYYYERGITIDGATYKGQPIFGSITRQTESTETNGFSSTQITTYGTLTIGEDKYKTTDFTISYDIDYSKDKKEDWEIENFKFGGSLICNEKPVDLETLTEDNPMVSIVASTNADAKDLFDKDASVSTIASCIKYDSNIAKGMYSSLQEVVSGAYRFDLRLNLGNITLDGESHSVSCRLLMEVSIDGSTVDFDYIMLDGKYFTPSSIKEDSSFFYKMIGTFLMLGKTH